MNYPDPDVQRAADLYQLALPRTPAAGRSGEMLGRGTGSSLEFQEYRQYLPGDDIRHLDWAAYARSDTLMVRLYREEISPRTEILLDASLSMNSGGEVKPRVARQIAALLALLSARLGGRPTIVPLTEGRPAPLGLEGLNLLPELAFSGRSTLAEMLNAGLVPLKKQSIRIVISDFLFPHEPAALVRRLAADASTLWVVQLLNAWEAQPAALGGRRMVDIETAAEADIIFDRKAVAGYQRRLEMLQDELRTNCRRMHGTFLTLVAERGLDSICREELCSSGLLRIA